MANPASGFRFCVIAAPGAKLIEVDFSGIEGVLTGYFMGDPEFIRIAKLSMNAHLTSNMPQVNKPGDLSWPVDKLLAHFAWIKETYPRPYDEAKRVVYLTSYCGTPRMMQASYPDTFPTIKDAERIQNIYFALAPKLKTWQHAVQELAYKQGYLGGPAKHGDTYHTSGAHPFGYRHFFFNVLSYRPFKGIAPKGAQVVRIGGRNYVVTRGEDAKRAVAFFPQSTAAGILKEVMLRLFVPGEPNYIGEAFYGRTPLRAPIHDALLLEVPDELVDEVLRKVVYEMTRPIPQLPLPAEWGLGPYLSIGVEAKVGRNWAVYNDKHTDRDGNPLRLNLDGMKKVKLPNVEPSIAADVIVPVDVYDEDEEIEEVTSEQSAG